MSDLLEFKCPGGVVRRCGALEPDITKVRAGITKYFEDVCPNMVLDDADIIKLVKNTKRTPARQEFDEHWIVEGDQGSPGSCNGWMTSSIESKLRWRRGIRDGIVLSGSYIYSLINGGFDNGSPLNLDIDVMTRFGAPPAKLCGPNNIWRKNTKQFDIEAAKYKQLNWLPTRTLQGWFSAVAQGALGASCVDVGSQFQQFKGNGIVPVGSGNGNHAVHADDIVIYKGVLAADSPGNWNLTWGNRGRGLFTKDCYARPFRIHQFYVAFTTWETLL